ncbi:MAG: hypothetical protein OEO77_01570 [Acidimicrobiia bacterium]|nr:hypothetical protein [Acidimicrobiia bacterium]
MPSDRTGVVTATHHRWLTQLTDLPAVAGREELPVGWVRSWAARRPNVRFRLDAAGNILLRSTRRSRRRPLLLTAHLDHPGFVIGEAVGRRRHAFEFRGGVLNPYFEDAAIEIFASGARRRAIVTDLMVDGRHRTGTVQLRGSGPDVRPGDLGRWALPVRSLGIKSGRLQAHACDDLAGVAAVLAAFDGLREKAPHVGVLLTRAEEVGFVGAIAAGNLGSIPDGAELICVEMSRSFADSPIGAGPVVRVGDASSVFDASLTNRAAALAGRLAARPAGFAWQRKLMTGGSCEATAFGGMGYAATCLCLPLGNYHNMAEIDAVRSGARPARVRPEIISLADFDGLVALLKRIGLAEAGDGVDAWELTGSEWVLLGVDRSADQS